ncbi:HD domain-containing phosphohydrolase [Comamonas sp.]|uniref:HD domain-containing phosphohydrolase n=1 Tax=Comamonas sp. TaxID=34028 RepID=UPI003A8CEC76
MPMRIKFQHWIVSASTLLILLLTAVFMALVFGQFQGLAVSSAEEKFNLIADKVFLQLEESLQTEKRFVEIMSTSDVGWPNPDTAFEDAENLLPTVSRALQTMPIRFSAYFGFPNDDFLQVIAVRSNPAIEADLYAPPGTFEAYRTIRANLRTESWSFRDQDGQVLGERTTPTTYRPSQRVWYTQAKNAKTVQVSAPYIFVETASHGLTFSAPTPNGTAVFGSDITLTAFNDILNRLKLSPHATVLVTDEELRVLAKRKGGALYGDLPPGRIVSLRDLDNKYLKAVADLGRPSKDLLAETIELAGENFMLTSRRMTSVQGANYRIYVIAPLSDFTGIVLKTQQNVLWAALAAIVLLIPLAYLGTRGVTRSLTALTRQSERIRQLDFSSKPEPVPSRLYEVHVLSRAQEVMHDSLKERTEALEAATQKLARLVDIGILLGREKDKNTLLKNVLLGARDIAHCQSAALFLKTDHQTLRLTMLTDDIPMPELELNLRDASTGESNHHSASADAVWNGKTVVVDDVASDKRFDFTEALKLAEISGHDIRSLLTLPLSAHEGEVLGVILLRNALDPKTGQLSRFDSETVKYAEALTAEAAIIIENQQLIQAQKELMDSMIKIIAGAIDAKSAYTGGHCERVPELAVMLAEEASKVNDGPLADFSFRNEDEWQEFRIGAWLHDCGKVTTPEYVVDKATKLETIYNRIHEIRTRFEVLLRDAMIERLESIWERGVPPSQADAIFQQKQTQLLADYAFVAQSNVGGEFMAPERVERIAAIGSMTWMRHFDDRLGLSQEEENRLTSQPAPALPAQERLLADKPHHIVPRTAESTPDAKYGFQVKVPQHLYNQGEIYNLSISRGTLTEEERFKINEHIIQTIVMLDNMPFPKHLKRVPEYASTHHETLSGTGYPRKLLDKDLSVPSRIMAIADIFEALTASDRPYKKAKTLSEAIKILSFFKKDRHIDPVLFDLFLTSGVYRRYAERFLLPEQMDEVDVTMYVTST